MRWLDKMKSGLKKTARLFADTGVDLDCWEDALIQTDMGVHTAQELIKVVQNKSAHTPQQIRQILHQEMSQKLAPCVRPMDVSKQMTVILMVGVNGAGKTTTIGKLAAKYRLEKKRVALVAGDTFRAGAVEQLCLWAEKTGADFYCGKENQDAASVIFDALKQAQNKGTDIVLVDTAGRLQNRTDLMDELAKIVRVMKKVDVAYPHETVLVLDATNGQNALNQVRVFMQLCPLSGLIMTKLDGTAKGGILLALVDQFHLPIYAIGVGEQVDDLNDFNVSDYVSVLLGDETNT